MPMPSPPTSLRGVLFASTKEPRGQIPYQLLQRITSLWYAIPTLIKASRQVLCRIRIIIVRWAFVLVMHQLRRISARALSPITFTMFPSPMSALPIPTRLRITKPLLRTLRTLLTRLGRVHLIRIQIKPDAGRAACTWRSYTICTHKVQSVEVLAREGSCAASRDRRTRILSIARIVD